MFYLNILFLFCFEIYIFFIIFYNNIIKCIFSWEFFIFNHIGKLQ